MGHTPYGYSIENAAPRLKEDEANKIRKLYENYLSGMALAKAAAAAGIETYHGTAKRLMENRHYLGDDFYPAIIDQEPTIKLPPSVWNAPGNFGRLNRKKKRGVLQLLLPAFAWQRQSNTMKIRGCRQNTSTASLKAR